MEKSVYDIFAEFERRMQPGLNPADVLNAMEIAGQIPADHLSPILHRILVKSNAYRFVSINLPDSVPDWQDLLKAASFRTGFESVITYFQTEQCIRVINPLDPEHWKRALPLLPGNLLVIYTRSVPERDPCAEESFLTEFRETFGCLAGQTGTNGTGRDVRTIRESPKYAIQVTNEFFHYGNVEAWQNIIAHYQETHTDSKIHVFHRNRPIGRISKLFKWGRVSVGDVIQFSVTGPDFRDVAKLKKYLAMGASPRYLPFIKKHLYDNLNLF